MAKATLNDKPQFALPPTGTTLARCFKVIHLGTQQSDWKGKVKIKPWVKVGWELPLLLHSFGEGQPEKPFRLTRKYPFTIFEGSNFRKLIEAWGNRQLTESEKTNGFDPKVLLNKTCQLTVAIEKGTDGNQYAVPSSIGPLMKEMKDKANNIVQHAQTCPPLISGIVYFDPENPETFAAWELLTDAEKAEIRKSPEYKLNAREIEPSAAPAQTGVPVASSDDIDDKEF